MSAENFCEGCPLRVENRPENYEPGQSVLAVSDDVTLRITSRGDQGCGPTFARVSGSEYGDRLETAAKSCPGPKGEDLSSGWLSRLLKKESAGKQCPVALRFGDDTSIANVERLTNEGEYLYHGN